MTSKGLTPKRLERRLRQLLEKFQLPPSERKRCIPKSGYDIGQKRCTRCLKFFNLEDPQEMEQIVYGRSGRMYHNKYRCPVYSPYPATLVSTAKFHRSKKDVKRY